MCYAEYSYFEQPGWQMITWDGGVSVDHQSALARTLIQSYNDQTNRLEASNAIHLTMTRVDLVQNQCLPDNTVQKKKVAEQSIV